MGTFQMRGRRAVWILFMRSLPRVRDQHAAPQIRLRVLFRIPSPQMMIWSPAIVVLPWSRHQMGQLPHLLFFCLVLRMNWAGRRGSLFVTGDSCARLGLSMPVHDILSNLTGVIQYSSVETLRKLSWCCQPKMERRSESPAMVYKCLFCFHFSHEVLCVHIEICNFP
jgi:hypothetical protein